MKATTFWTWLIIVTSLTGLSLWGLKGIEEISQHLSVSALLLILMFLATVFLFYFGKRAAASEDKYSFIRLVIIGVMSKIVLVVAVIAIYVKSETPDNRFFVLPFIGVYLIFSVFETVVLYKLALTKSLASNE